MTDRNPVRLLSLGALMGLAGSTLVASPAAAAGVTCLKTSCHTVLMTHGGTYYGAYGTWNRAAMKAPGASRHNGNWVNSEMWAMWVQEEWVETGITNGWLGPAKTTGYFGFVATQSRKRVYREYSFGRVKQKRTVTDQYQISRSPKKNKWRVYFNGALKTTSNVGFWKVRRIDVGGEAYGRKVVASTFRMSVRALTASGKRVRPPKQEPGVWKGMQGKKLRAGEWKWSIK